MEDLKINGNFQELSEEEAESIEGGFQFFTGLVGGAVLFAHSVIDTGIFALEFIDRGAAAVFNTPANLIRWIFKV